MITVLVTTAGSAAGINCINALRNQAEIELRIVASDASQYAAGLYLADHNFLVPTFEHEQEYISSLLDICQKESVDVILPTYSAEIPIVAKFVDEFRSKNINLCLSPLSSIKKFSNKWDAYLFFRETGILTPDTWQLSTLDKVNQPLYVKPIVGSGSRKNHLILGDSELHLLKTRIEQGDYIAQTLIKAKEFTVDILANHSSKVLSMVPRERIATKNGLAVVSRTIDEPKIGDLVEELVEKAKLVGTFNMQYFKTHENKFLVFDVNTRFAAGGLPLSIRAGINFPLETIKLALGIEVKANKDYQRDLTMIRYYTELFVE